MAAPCAEARSNSAVVALLGDRGDSSLGGAADRLEPPSAGPACPQGLGRSVQTPGALGVVLSLGQCRKAVEVMGDAHVVAHLAGKRQALFQESLHPRRISLRLLGAREVRERQEHQEPVAHLSRQAERLLEAFLCLPESAWRRSTWPRKSS
jgi:hypothetical protein